MQIPLEKIQEDMKEKIPLYFTNLQRGLALARKLLCSREIHNKQILLITDGVPTAHIEKGILYLNYPPTEKDMEYALKEAKACKEEGIIINTFLLSSEWDLPYSYSSKEPFIKRFAQVAEGRIFHTHPYELGVMVLYDFLKQRKRHIRFEKFT